MSTTQTPKLAWKRMTDVLPQLVSIEYSRQLKELGMLQNSQFYYDESLGSQIHTFSAFTVPELLELMPYFVTVHKIKCGNILLGEDYPDQYAAAISGDTDNYGYHASNSAANALAFMIINMIKDGWWSVCNGKVVKIDVVEIEQSTERSRSGSQKGGNND